MFCNFFVKDDTTMLNDSYEYDGDIFTIVDEPIVSSTEEIDGSEDKKEKKKAVAIIKNEENGKCSKPDTNETANTSGDDNSEKLTISGLCLCIIGCFSTFLCCN